MALEKTKHTNFLPLLYNNYKHSQILRLLFDCIAIAKFVITLQLLSGHKICHLFVTDCLRGCKFCDQDPIAIWLQIFKIYTCNHIVATWLH